jgi:hypothetical protein
MKRYFGAFLILFFLTVFGLIACSNKTPEFTGGIPVTIEPLGPIDSLIKAHFFDSLPSQSIGTVGNGKLINGRLVPFSGDNFFYFDSTSYMNKRAFVHEKVLKVVLKTYEKLENSAPKH